MTDDDSNTGFRELVDSRRSFLEKGALTAGVTALGLGGFGLVEQGSAPAAAGDGGNETDTPTGDGSGAEGGKALMFVDEFRPGAQFRVTSPVVEQNPDVLGVDQGAVFSEYNTRIVKYLNTNEEVYFFPAQDAEVEEGVVYELHDNFTLFDDDSADSGIIDVRFEPVPDEDILIPQRDNQLEPLDDFDVTEGGGKALVQASNFYAGALMRITSDVVEWTPRPDVAGSDIFSAYNTRHARYLNTGDEFRVYTAHEGEFEPGAVYLVRDEFDITDPEGQLVTADLDRVDEDDLNQDLLEFD